MRDILQDIEQYPKHLSISKVITYFERKGVTITRSMIQNYVRDGLLPPPLNKRHYTHKHMVVLAIVSLLKMVYDMTHIKAALSPYMEEEGISIELYRRLIGATNRFVNGREYGFATTNGFATDNEESADPLVLMAYSADLKNQVLISLEGHGD